MNVPPALGIAAAPAFGVVLLVAQAADDAARALADPTGFGILKLVTETAVGVSILATVILFLKDRAADRKERAAENRKRDDAIRSIADDFRGDVKAIVDRLETSQARLVERFEGNQNQILAITREALTALAGHDATIKSLSDRQHKLEMDVYHHVGGTATRRAIEADADGGEAR